MTWEESEREGSKKDIKGGQREQREFLKGKQCNRLALCKEHSECSVGNKLQGGEVGHYLKMVVTYKGGSSRS